ncbi:MAG TPA: ATP-binding protein [Ignavibacteriales bacterium]|nr:ATP-binding protein [Ignavibacteriales bacterium]
MDYARIFREFNPVYYSAFTLILISFVVYILYTYVIIPSRITYIKEKRKLKAENLKLMALFAQLDPDPILRINREGIIIQSNQVAESLFGKKLEGENIHCILTTIKYPGQAINSNLSQTFFLRLFNRHYCIFFRGISEMNFAQIYFRDITEQKNYEEKLKSYSVHLQHSIEEERKRIAKELHDGIGQNLSLAKFKLQLLSSKLKSELPNTDFKEVKVLLEKSINELKDISYNLKPGILDEIGLEPALISLCNSVSLASSIQGHVQFEELKVKLDNMQETTLYRITQEALNNITKHSGASEFSVRIIQDNENARLIISDNGVGFDLEDIKLKSSKIKSMGLTSMKERAESIGGHFEIETSPREGTFIAVEIPFRTGEQ